MSHLIDSGDDGPGDPLVERHETAQRESDSYDRGFEKGGAALYAAIVGELNLTIDPDCETPACAIICAVNHIIAKARDAGLADRDRLDWLEENGISVMLRGHRDVIGTDRAAIDAGRCTCTEVGGGQHWSDHCTIHGRRTTRSGRASPDGASE